MLSFRPMISDDLATVGCVVEQTFSDHHGSRPQREHTEIEEELHELAHIDYDRVSIVSDSQDPITCSGAQRSNR